MQRNIFSSINLRTVPLSCLIHLAVNREGLWLIRSSFRPFILQRLQSSRNCNSGRWENNCVFFSISQYVVCCCNAFSWIHFHIPTVQTSDETEIGQLDCSHALFQSEKPCAISNCQVRVSWFHLLIPDFSPLRDVSVRCCYTWLVMRPKGRWHCWIWCSTAVLRNNGCKWPIEIKCNKHQVAVVCSLQPLMMDRFLSDYNQSTTNKYSGSSTIN